MNCSRFWLRSLFSVALLIVGPEAVSHAGSPQYTDAERHSGRYFFPETPPGTIGLLEPGHCADRKVEGPIYVMRENIYYGYHASCVHIIINHALAGEDDSRPTYVVFQVVAYYTGAPETTVFVNRRGDFRRNGKLLPPMPEGGRSYDKGQITVADFDSVHQPGSSENDSDTLLGFRWHGAPDGDVDEDSWDSRDRFRSENLFDKRFPLTSRAVEHWLMRFQPYVGSPNYDKLVGVNIYVHNAAAIAVKVFSPYSEAYNGSFALALTDDALVDNTRENSLPPGSQVAGGCGLFSFVFGCK